MEATNNASTSTMSKRLSSQSLVVQCPWTSKAPINGTPHIRNNSQQQLKRATAASAVNSQSQMQLATTSVTTTPAKETSVSNNGSAERHEVPMAVSSSSSSSGAGNNNNSSGTTNSPLQHSSSQFFHFLRLMQLFPDVHPATLHSVMSLCKNDFFGAVDKLLYAKRCKNYYINSQQQQQQQQQQPQRNNNHTVVAGVVGPMPPQLILKTRSTSNGQHRFQPYLAPATGSRKISTLVATGNNTTSNNNASHKMNEEAAVGIAATAPGHHHQNFCENNNNVLSPSDFTVKYPSIDVPVSYVVPETSNSTPDLKKNCQQPTNCHNNNNNGNVSGGDDCIPARSSTLEEDGLQHLQTSQTVSLPTSKVGAINIVEISSKTNPTVVNNNNNL